MKDDTRRVFSNAAVSKRAVKHGTPLFGSDGAFHRVLEDFLNTALEGEMESHLNETKPTTKNRRDGKMPKTNLSHYFKYTTDIRHIIYTTNTVEGYHRQIRKVTKTKVVFPNDDAILKIVYLAYRNIKKKWTMPVPNWGLTAQQFAIAFGDRFQII